jgi:mannose-6-phosphate isomerase-like protein (cupin superfamily)
VLHVPAGEGPKIWMSGDTYTLKATSENTGGRLSFSEASIPPGAGPVPHVHLDADEAYYILNGELEVLDGERLITARAGDFVFIPRGTLHRFRNTGVDAARMVFLFTPAGFDKFFLEAGKPAVAGVPPQWDEDDDLRVLEIAPRYSWTPGADVPAAERPAR